MHDDTSEAQQSVGADDDDVEEVQSPLQEKAVAETDSDLDADAEPPQHETLQKTNKKKSATKKVKYVPEGETREQRDMRSIFVGNLPVAIVKSKVRGSVSLPGRILRSNTILHVLLIINLQPLGKQLKRHILTYAPTAQIESVRYRSVAFQNPTTKIDDDAEDEASAKKLRSHKRATEWRDKGKGKPVDEEEVEDRKGEKQFMTPAQKRRLAAIKGDLHESAAATVNAYVVFAYPVPPAPTEDNTESKRRPTEVMDPFEATREVVKACDGSSFEGRTLRVDFVKKPAGISGGSSDVVLTDPKLSVFVGNLDFASTEDDLRAFFEKVMVEERGKPSSELKKKEAAKADDDESEEEKETDEEDEEASNKKVKLDKGNAPIAVDKKPTWVTRVRIVRDRDTQLGKGFAYVQFVVIIISPCYLLGLLLMIPKMQDRDCVDELLALEPEKLKFAKRKLRVQKCKTVPGASLSSAAPKGAQAKPPVNTPTHSNRFNFTPRAELPKGDPTLGTRIAALPKEQRKAAKAADPTRTARRLAKKKVRMSMEKDLQKGATKGKERFRERKDRREKGTMNKGKKDAKKRVRSEKSLEKRNAKK